MTSPHSSVLVSGRAGRIIVLLKEGLSASSSTPPLSPLRLLKLQGETHIKVGDVSLHSRTGAKEFLLSLGSSPKSVFDSAPYS